MFRLCFQPLCLPFRPFPYLTWPITCHNSTGLNDPTMLRLPPTLLPFQKQSPAKQQSEKGVVGPGVTSKTPARERGARDRKDHAEVRSVES